MLGSSLIPQPYAALARVAAVALVLLAVFAIGHHSGAVSVQTKWDAERANQTVAVAKAQAKQAEHVAAVIQKQTTITEDTDRDYQTARSALAAFNARGVRDVVAGRDHPRVPAVAATAGQPDAGSADAGLGADAPEAVDQCAALRSDAALTTLQLLHLQDWIVRQSAPP